MLAVGCRHTSRLSPFNGQMAKVVYSVLFWPKRTENLIPVCKPVQDNPPIPPRIKFRSVSGHFGRFGEFQVISVGLLFFSFFLFFI